MPTGQQNRRSAHRRQRRLDRRDRGALLAAAALGDYVQTRAPGPAPRTATTQSALPRRLPAVRLSGPSAEGAARSSASASGAACYAHPDRAGGDDRAQPLTSAAVSVGGNSAARSSCQARSSKALTDEPASAYDGSKGVSVRRSRPKSRGPVSWRRLRLLLLARVPACDMAFRSLSGRKACGASAGLIWDAIGAWSHGPASAFRAQCRGRIACDLRKSRSRVP